MKLNYKLSSYYLFTLNPFQTYVEFLQDQGFKNMVYWLSLELFILLLEKGIKKAKALNLESEKLKIVASSAPYT